MLPAMATATTIASPFRSCSSNPRRLVLAAPVRHARLRPRLAVLAFVPDPAARLVEYTPWLIAGLGNPGNKYQGTRHNVGFEMLDHIARVEGIMMNTIQPKLLLGVGSIGDVPVLLVKPQSYMN